MNQRLTAKILLRKFLSSGGFLTCQNLTIILVSLIHEINGCLISNCLLVACELLKLANQPFGTGWESFSYAQPGKPLKRLRLKKSEPASADDEFALGK